MQGSPGPRRLRPGRLMGLATAVLAVSGACAVVPTGSTTAAPGERTAPAPSGPATPGATGATVPSASASIRPVPSSPSQSVPPLAPAATPPVASLSAEGGDPVAGQLGSYTWGDSGSDSPWLPGAPMTIGAREPLSISFADGPPVARWAARRARAGAMSPVGAVPAGGGVGRITIDAPAAGSWTLAVTVEFARGVGTATWYWRLDVR